MRPLLLPLAIVLAFIVVVHGFEKPYCQFKAPNYSIEWAYEPSSRNVVFVLKVQSSRSEFWTGVGFSESSQKTVDFVGVLVRNGYVVLADAYVNASGILYTDLVGNLQIIGYDYDGNTLTAKFARSILSDDVKHDIQLDECTTFLFPNAAGPIRPEGIKPELSDFNRLQVCDIQKHCSIEVSKKTTDATEKPKSKKLPPPKETKNEELRFAKSVDVSGKGDPCSFTGTDYTVNWTYDKETDRVNFIMKQSYKKGNWWSAVGIGDNMSDMDIAVIFLENGDIRKLGDYYSNKYGVPDEDDQQDWKLDKAKKFDNQVEMRFSRALITDDVEKDRTLDNCVLFQFASNIGKYGKGFSLNKHESWPDLYKACDLREHCAAIDSTPTTSKKHAKAKPTTTTTVEPKTEESNDDEKSFEIKHSSIQAKVNKPEKLRKKSKVASKKSEEDELESSGQEEETTPVPSTDNIEGSGEEEQSTIVTSTAEPSTTTTELADDETESTVEETEATTPTPIKTTAKLIKKTTTIKPKPKKLDLSVESEENATEAPSKSTKSDGITCDALKPDLGVCQSYMDNYLAQVRDWAARHDELMEDQYGKACALLNAVPHVPTLCCHSYRKICNSQISRKL